MYEPTPFAIQTLTTLQQQALRDFGLVSAEREVLKIGAEIAGMYGSFRGGLSDSEREHWLTNSTSQIEGAYEARRITPLQDPVDQMFLSKVVEESRRRVAAVQNATFPERAIVASLPVGQMNALTMHLPETDEYLILFQRGLFGLLNLLSRAVSSVWPEGRPGQGSPLLARRDELEYNFSKFSDPGGYFVDVLEQSLIRGNPNGYPVIPQPPNRAGLKEALLVNAEVFILGHEYGHILRGHFGTEKEVTVKFGNRALSATSRSHQQEFAADLTGFEYANSFGLLDPTQQYLAYCGTGFFFSCQDIVEDALRLLAGENDAKRARDTHPKGANRKKAIDNILRFQIGYENARLVAQGYAEMHWILEEFWRMAKSRWAEVGKKGGVASPVWAAAVESYERPSEENSFTEGLPDATAKELGMPSLRDMESFKGIAFLALLDMFAGDISKRRRAAEWLLENPHLVVFSLVSEIAYGAPDRRDAFIAHLLERAPGLTKWVSMLQFVIGRYPDNNDLAGVPEIIMSIMSGMEYLREIARQTQACETIDYVRILIDVEYRVHQRNSFDAKGDELSDSPGSTIS